MSWARLCGAEASENYVLRDKTSEYFYSQNECEKQHFPKRKGDRDGRGRKLFSSKESRAAEEPENDSEKQFSAERLEDQGAEDRRR